MKPRKTSFFISHQDHFSNLTPHTTNYCCSNGIGNSNGTHLANYLISILDSLDGIEENPIYHPEGDCLYHSLQVFQHALPETDNPTLWAAALFHDIGKSVDYVNHAIVGSDMLKGLLNPNITWLTRHHLDLLKSPKKTRQKWKGTQQLCDLESLRRWDLAGRQTNAFVMSTQEAVDILQPHFNVLTQSNETYYNISNT